MDKISPMRTAYVYIMHSQGVYTKCVLHVVIVFSEQLLRRITKAGGVSTIIGVAGLG